MVHKMEEKTQFPGARAVPLYKVAGTNRVSLGQHHQDKLAFTTFSPCGTLSIESQERKSDGLSLHKEVSMAGVHREPRPGRFREDFTRWLQQSSLR